MAEQQTVPDNRRVYVVFDSEDDGTVVLRMTLRPPALGEPSAVFIWRGMLPQGSPMTLPFVSDPSKNPALKGPAGRAPTTQEIASAVAAYLTANPPAKGDPGATPLGTVTITQTATVALSAGIRSLVVAVPGVKPGDNILLFPAGTLPAGYVIHNAVATAANQLTVYFTAPLLAINASFSIPCRVVRIG